MNSTPRQRPKLRGYFHQESFAKSSSSKTLLAALIYSFGLLSMLGVSALYHRVHWELKARTLMKRLDHSAIFIQIAGTFTPICLLALNDDQGSLLLTIIWGAAISGILKSIFWVKSPKFISALFYVIMGWLALPYVSELKAALGENQIYLIISGGIVFTVGSIFYATKKPNIIPGVFGYHELFHLFTIVGAGLHFIVIYQLIT